MSSSEEMSSFEKMSSPEDTPGAERSGEKVRRWIKVGDDPLRYEYGRENKTLAAPAIQDQLAYVEEEKHSSYFHWETYTTHEKGAEPTRKKAQAAAIEALREERRA